MAVLRDYNLFTQEPFQKTFSSTYYVCHCIAVPACVCGSMGAWYMEKVREEKEVLHYGKT